MTQIVTVDDDSAETNDNNDDDNDVPSWPLANDCIYEAEPHILWQASLLPFMTGLSKSEIRLFGLKNGLQGKLWHLIQHVKKKVI